ncbi:Tyrosine/serine-protein phosphatase IphP-type, partial [Jimgerdemannia flammicorona]
DIAGISRTHVPIFRSEDWSPSAQTIKLNHYFDGPEGGRKVLSRGHRTLQNRLGSTYHEIVKSGAPFFRTIFLHIIDHPYAPLLVHCTAGKDRTGVFGMLLLSLCGVEDEVICGEYELTQRTSYGNVV